MKVTRAVAATLLGLGITFGTSFVAPSMVFAVDSAQAIVSVSGVVAGEGVDAAKDESACVDLTYIDMYGKEQLAKDLTPITLKSLEADEAALARLQQEELQLEDFTIADPAIQIAEVQEFEQEHAEVRAAAALEAKKAAAVAKADEAARVVRSAVDALVAAEAAGVEDLSSYLAAEDAAKAAAEEAALAAEADPVPYEGSCYLLTEGWYALTEDVVLDKPLVLEGNVRIVLAGGHTLVAREGVRAKTGATIAVFGEKDKAGTLTVRKGLTRVLTKDERVAREERIARIREIIPTYDPEVAEKDAQILYVWPCMDVTAGDRDPWSAELTALMAKLAEENGDVVDADANAGAGFVDAADADATQPSQSGTLDPNPELAPQHVDKPVLDEELLTKGYVSIQPLDEHSIYCEDALPKAVDGHYLCTVCDGWFEDAAGERRIAKPGEILLDMSAHTSEELAAEYVEGIKHMSAGLVVQVEDETDADSSGKATTNKLTNQDSDADSGLSLYAAAETVIISFDANGGSGTMDPMTVTAGEPFMLPECTFEPPEGKVFNSWNLGRPGSTVSVPIDTTLKAWWKTDTSENSSSTSGSSENSGSSSENGTSSNASGTGSSTSEGTSEGSSSNTSGATGSDSTTSTDSSTTRTTTDTTNNTQATDTQTDANQGTQRQSTASGSPQTGDSLMGLTNVAALLSVLGTALVSKGRAYKK